MVKIELFYFVSYVKGQCCDFYCERSNKNKDIPQICKISK